VPHTPYTPDDRPRRETAEELRARIPGWGVDLDPEDRPAVPRQRFDPGASGAHWHHPERQPEEEPRERSIEHAELTPVFGTAVPLRGLSGAVRRYAYRRFSEGRAAHWLLLIAADRVDVVESTVLAALRGRPDNPVAETGVRAETTHHGWSSRVGVGRADVKHLPLDPVIVAGPWVLGGLAAVVGVRALVRRVRS
jgi:hypothetical protein